MFDYPQECGFKFNRFPPLAETEVHNIINSMQTKSCELEPLPTELLKGLLPSCLQILMRLVNMSLEQGIFCEK